MKIKSITIELGKGKDKKEIKLSVDEAKELSQQLNELFDNKEVVIKREYIPWYRKPYWEYFGTTWSSTDNFKQNNETLWAYNGDSVTMSVQAQEEN